MKLHLVLAGTALALALPVATQAERTYEPLPPNVSTPETAESKIGTLDFPGGYPLEQEHLARDR